MNVMSQSVIDQLVRDTSIDLLPIMVNSFIEELERRANDFEQTAAQWQAESAALPLRDAAHALKSCSGTFGAELLYEHAKILEDALRAELSDPIATYIVNVRQALQQTMECYCTYRETLNSVGEQT